ncbi:MAG: hypothetical protein ACR2HG_14160, partial [Pyrinomonadaceae bacterium]
EMDNANPELESGDQSNGDTFRGQNADSGTDRKLIYTKYLTPSKIQNKNSASVKIEAEFLFVFDYCFAA